MQYHITKNKKVPKTYSKHPVIVKTLVYNSTLNYYDIGVFYGDYLVEKIRVESFLGNNFIEKVSFPFDRCKIYKYLAKIIIPYNCKRSYNSPFCKYLLDKYLSLSG